jgi:hypothetical protein
VRRLFLIAAILLLPSLALAQEIGEGELWLHEQVMEWYRQFDSDSDASFFAVSTNGYDAGYSYCPSFGDCYPLDGKREAIQACNSNRSDLPSTCYIFANENRILWRGEIHVLNDQEFMAHLYGPDTIKEAMAEFVGAAHGPVEGSQQSFKASPAVWKSPDFNFPPAGFALVSDECRYAFKKDYLPNGARNFFLADKTGRYCAYATGFAQANEAAAFGAAAAACKARAPLRLPCLVYAVDDQLLSGRSGL